MASMKGKRVLITGGSSGIGRATAQALRDAGAAVCVVARRAEPLTATVEALGGGTWSHVCDVADEALVAQLAGAVHERWGGLDGLVNSAGAAPMGSLEETDPETWDHAFAVNVRAPFLLARTLRPLLDRGAMASVVSVSSTLAEKAIGGMVAYNASKAALNQLTRSLALEWAPRIRVNAVMPGVVDTPIHEGRGMTSAQVKGMGRIHPMRRIGRPEDVAAMVLFLLSEEASWMTGAVIPVDGGMMAT